MKKRLISLLSFLMTAVLLFASVPAFALTGEENEAIYQEAFSELEAYLEDRTEDADRLREIGDSFQKIPDYKSSRFFAGYVKVLLLLAEEEYDSADLEYEMYGNLMETAMDFCSIDLIGYDSPVVSPQILEQYMIGRIAAHRNDDSAIEKFKECGSFYDSKSRYEELVNVHYNRAHDLFVQTDYAGAYMEYKLCLGYGDSDSRMNFIVKKLGYAPDHEHDWDEGQMTVEATCVTEGEMTFHCNVCGISKAEAVATDPEKHTGETEITGKQEASCLTDGYTGDTVCGSCGAILLKGSIVPAAGDHDWDDGTVTVPATCGSNGTMIRCCRNCTATREEVILATGDHDWDDGRVTVSATCLEPGERQYKCKNCNEKKTEYIPAIGAHDWDAGKVTKKATCSSFGVVLYTCKACGQTRSESIAKDKNNHAGGTEICNMKDATCVSVGYTGDTYCKSCGVRISSGNTVSATGKHNWIENVTKEATCTASGTMTYICKGCGQTRSESIAKDKNNHAGETEIRNMKDATCGANGYTGDIYCKSCGAMIKSGRTVAATGKHDWQEATSFTPKTCRVCGRMVGEPSKINSDDCKRIGSYITFGNYYQNNDSEKEPIEWLVLDYDSKTNRVLVISRYGLDAQPYNTYRTDVTWETCTLRTWLNREFLNAAFSAEEQKAIPTVWVDNSENQCYRGWNTNGGNNTQDRIFLLSYAETNKYFTVQHNSISGARNNSRSRTAPTAYAISQGASQSTGVKTADGEYSGWWWLRSPGSSRGYAAYVLTYGSLYSLSVNYDNGSVRPALWLDLSGI